MIYTCPLSSLKNNEKLVSESSTYLITRSDRVYNDTLKELGVVYTNVLAPPWDLYNEAQKIKKGDTDFNWWYDTVYVPRFFKYLKNKSCVYKLIELINECKHKDIILVCFCTKERCHAKLVANVLSTHTNIPTTHL